MMHNQVALVSKNKYSLMPREKLEYAGVGA
jgi:hypothetical protein